MLNFSSDVIGELTTAYSHFLAFLFTDYLFGTARGVYTSSAWTFITVVSTDRRVRRLGADTRFAATGSDSGDYRTLELVRRQLRDALFERNYLTTSIVLLICQMFLFVPPFSQQHLENLVFLFWGQLLIAVRLA